MSFLTGWQKPGISRSSKRALSPGLSSRRSPSDGPVADRF
nr:MAG TPA: hypothetical protein [Caudoviricetes sp.]